MQIELPDRFAEQLRPGELLVDLAAGMYAARHLTFAAGEERYGGK